MKSPIDIPEKELREAIRLTSARTKSEAVSTAITEFNRRKRRERLAEKLGTFENVTTPEDLIRLRETQ